MDIKTVKKIHFDMKKINMIYNIFLINVYCIYKLILNNSSSFTFIFKHVSRHELGHRT